MIYYRFSVKAESGFPYWLFEGFGKFIGFRQFIWFRFGFLIIFGYVG